MCAQTFRSGIPKAIRQNIQQYLIWFTSDHSQLDAIYEEVANLVTKEQFELMFRKATQEKFSFLVVDNNPRHPYLHFRKNFDTVLLPPHSAAEDEPPK